VPQLLEKAISEIRKLPESDQNAIAAVLMAELEAEQRWEQAFDRTHDQLAELAAEALAEYKAGRTQPLDPDRA
jgi:methylase of polypeptide subunit release factors